MKESTIEKVKQILIELLLNDSQVIHLVQEIANTNIVNSEKDTIVNVVNSEKDTNHDLNQQEDNSLLISELEGKIELVTKEKCSLQEEVRQLKEELLKVTQKLEEKEEKLVAKEKALITSIEKMEKIELDSRATVEKMQEKYQKLAKSYVNIDEIYYKYLNLGEYIIGKMERILNATSDRTESADIFMAFGAQENNIVALWESIATNFENYESEGKTEDLIDIFRYFLDVYKQVTYKSIHIEEPCIGDSYDERKHTRTSSSTAVGKIEKVILPGFSIGKNITKKALVIIK